MSADNPYIKHVPARWEVRDLRGVLLGTYNKREEARVALKTAQLMQMCEENAKARGAFQPYIV